MDDTPTPTTSLDDEWCSINAAAHRLGVRPSHERHDAAPT
jgi:hypothetical protein